MAGARRVGVNEDEKESVGPSLAPVVRLPWPKRLPEQVTAVRTALAARPAPATPSELASSFQGDRADRMAELLDALVALGQERRLEDGRVAG